jgi:hypothetical protein
MSPAPWTAGEGYEQSVPGNFVAASDGSIVAASQDDSDCVLRTADRDGIVAARNAGPELATFAVEFAKALPGLRIGHDEDCRQCTDPQHCGCGQGCDCTARTHNDRLAALAARLGIGLDGQPLPPPGDPT